MSQQQKLSFEILCNETTEAACLGSVLLGGRETLEAAKDILGRKPFYSARHKDIYSALLAEYEAGGEIDPVTVSNRLRDVGRLDSVGGHVYLMQLEEAVPTAANAPQYARRVRELADKRRMQTICLDIVKRLTGPESFGELRDELTAAVESIGYADCQEAREIKTLLVDYFAALDAGDAGDMGSLPTGLPSLDRIFAFRRGHLSVIGGRPSMGKSTLALNCAARMAEGGYRVAVYSNEMPARQIAHVILCMTARIDGQKLLARELTDPDWELLSHGVGKVSEWPLWIVHVPGWRASQIVAHATQMKQRHGLDAVFVDYVQNLRPEHTRRERRDEEVGESVRALADFAGRADVAMIVVSQINRESAKATDHRPTLDQLSQSDVIAQRAREVLLLYRPDYYDATVKDCNGESVPDFVQRTLCEINIAKQSIGPTGRVLVSYDPASFTFREFDTQVMSVLARAQF